MGRVAPRGQVRAAGESLREPFALASGTSIDLVHKGQILPLDAPLSACGIGDGETLFLVDESQPPSWRHSTSANEQLDIGGMGGADEQGGQRREHPKVGIQEENPLLHLIKELQNQVAHLRRSNAELQAEGPDPEFAAAVSENIAAIAKKEAIIADLQQQLEQIGGGGGAPPPTPGAGAADAMQTDGGLFL